ncbi:MAG: alanine--glyoxylate aminotransferase family protein [Dehalococcoidia bacterium]|jgi:aspartate aminotransferase-like enzyme|nr:alanine--glyoxylate aminotransferase family protein [Dehalococcoidia bacterium]
MPNLRIPGPTPVPSEVAQAGTAEMINHRGPEFAVLLERITDRAKRVYQTDDFLAVLSASGTGGMEAAVSNHISPGDHVLVVTVGVFGERFTQLVQAYGGEPTELSFEYGTAADANRVDKALAADPDIRAVLFTHNETSTGVANVQLKEIAEAAHGRDKLIIVDAISSLSSLPVPVDEYDLDVVVSGSQKGWMVPPGIAFVSVSDRAWEAAERCTTPRFYFDLKRAKESQETGQTPWTPAVSVLFQLDHALDMMFEEGLEQIYDRHRRLARRVRDGVRALGLDLFAAEGVESDTVTAIKVPEGIEARALLSTAREQFDTVFAGGQRTLNGKIFRFGHLGYVTDEHVDDGLKALESTLKQLGRG